MAKKRVGKFPKAFRQYYPAPLELETTSTTWSSVDQGGGDDLPPFVTPRPTKLTPALSGAGCDDG